jgi:HAD superfamily hydrolase (TIGR01509 family)
MIGSLLAARRCHKLEVLALATALAARHRVAVLTSNCRIVSDNIQYLNPAVAELLGHHIYASASFGAAKPTTHAYLRCLDGLGVSAAETLFIDDLEINVAEARYSAFLRARAD